MKEAISCDDQRPPEVISGHPRPSEAIRPLVAIRGHQSGLTGVDERRDGCKDKHPGCIKGPPERNRERRSGKVAAEQTQPPNNGPLCVGGQPWTEAQPEAA